MNLRKADVTRSESGKAAEQRHAAAAACTCSSSTLHPFADYLSIQTSASVRSSSRFFILYICRTCSYRT